MFGPWAHRRLAVCQHARTYGSPSKTRGWPAQLLLTPVPDPLVRANPSANPLRVHDFTPIPTAKPSPPRPRAENPDDPTNPSEPKQISPSPFPAPFPSPSEPVTMNLPKSASPPSQEVSAIRPKQGPPYDNTRMPRNGRPQGGMSPNVLPEEDVNMLPFEQSLEPQMHRNATMGGDRRGNVLPLQPSAGQSAGGDIPQALGGHREDAHIT